LSDRENLQQSFNLEEDPLDALPAPEPTGEDDADGEVSDWRVNNAQWIRGCTLIRRPFRTSQGGQPVEHCIACWAKFSVKPHSDTLDEGYATYTEYDWVCGNCYEDLRTRMQWKQAPSRIATLLTSGGGRIHHAHQEEWIPDVRAMFLEYAQSLGIDLGFQDFDRELADLPGEYNRVLGKGCLLVATMDDRLAGVVACRSWHHHIENAICEMKRLYVRPDFRGTGLGEALARAVIDEGRRLGYSRMRLDSLPNMEKAIRLYESLGFQRIEPYRHNPIEDSVFLELSL
jgi:putative acetyltransferase